MRRGQGFISTRIASFRFAFQGIATLIRTQFHARVHLTATIMVSIAGIVFNVSRMEWALLILATGMAWTAEAMNTAVEFAVDLASPDRNDIAGHAKDVAAAAVLLSAITATGIAVCVFVPYIAV